MNAFCSRGRCENKLSVFSSNRSFTSFCKFLCLLSVSKHRSWSVGDLLLKLLIDTQWHGSSSPRPGETFDKCHLHENAIRRMLLTGENLRFRGTAEIILRLGWHRKSCNFQEHTIDSQTLRPGNMRHIVICDFCLRY